MNFLTVPAPTINAMHRTLGVEFRNIDPVQAGMIRSVVLCNWIDDDDYKMKREVNPFLQGYTENPEGEWVYIEFWSDNKEKISAYLKHLESRVNDQKFYDLMKEMMDCEKE